MLTLVGLLVFYSICSLLLCIKTLTSQDFFTTSIMPPLYTSICFHHQTFI